MAKDAASVSEILGKLEAHYGKQEPSWPKRHGQELCKGAKPKCNQCPVNSSCAYFAGKHRERGARV